MLDQEQAEHIPEELNTGMEFKQALKLTPTDVPVESTSIEM